MMRRNFSAFRIILMFGGGRIGSLSGQLFNVGVWSTAPGESHLNNCMSATMQVISIQRHKAKSANILVNINDSCQAANDFESLVTAIERKSSQFI